jgi:hypothetical protein
LHHAGILAAFARPISQPNKIRTAAGPASFILQLEFQAVRKQRSEGIDLGFRVKLRWEDSGFMSRYQPLRPDRRVVSDPLWRRCMSGDFDDKAHYDIVTAARGRAD